MNSGDQKKQVLVATGAIVALSAAAAAVVTPATRAQHEFLGKSNARTFLSLFGGTVVSCLGMAILGGAAIYAKAAEARDQALNEEILEGQALADAVRKRFGNYVYPEPSDLDEQLKSDRGDTDGDFPPSPLMLWMMRGQRHPDDQPPLQMLLPYEGKSYLVPEAVYDRAQQLLLDEQHEDLAQLMEPFVQAAEAECNCGKLGCPSNR